VIRRVALGAALAGVLAMTLLGCGSGPDPALEGFEDIPGVGPTRVDVPRPTGIASAACDDDPLPPSTAETTVERVAALREIGLFADREGVSDAELAGEIDEHIEALWGPDLAVDDPFRDLAVAEQDAARILWIDLEADVGQGNEIYVSTLDQLQGISVGAFQPSAEEERWASADGPITVAFDLDGSRRELTPAALDDWIDPGILVEINGLIAESGRRFELYRAFDQTALVMALTEAERQALEGRGWCFE
jgi:hypothetical protein